MISLDLFDYTHMSELDKSITKYVNSNVECIIKVLLDYLEDDNGFTLQDFLPYNNFRIDDKTWIERVKDLYDIIRSDVTREFIEPKYEYLLYVILRWWDDCSECWDKLLPVELDSSLADKIQVKYESDDGECYVLNAITDFDEYYYILFADHDFLPDSLERLVTIYLRNPELFKKVFADVDLDEYRELMPKDLQECYNKKSSQQKDLIKKITPNKIYSMI